MTKTLPEPGTTAELLSRIEELRNRAIAQQKSMTEATWDTLTRFLRNVIAANDVDYIEAFSPPVVLGLLELAEAGVRVQQENESIRVEFFTELVTRDQLAIDHGRECEAKLAVLTPHDPMSNSLTGRMLCRSCSHTAAAHKWLERGPSDHCTVAGCTCVRVDGPVDLEVLVAFSMDLQIASNGPRAAEDCPPMLEEFRRHATPATVEALCRRIWMIEGLSRDRA